MNSAMDCIRAVNFGRHGKSFGINAALHGALYTGPVRFPAPQRVTPRGVRSETQEHYEAAHAFREGLRGGYG